MITKDLIRLPLCNLEITDGIYNYELSKELTESKSVVYVIIEKRSRKLFCLFESTENIFEDCEEYERKILRANMGIGGFYISSDDIYSSLNDLKFIPRGSFKKHIEITKTNHG